MPGHQLRRHRLGRNALPPVPSPNSAGTLRPQPRSKPTRVVRRNERKIAENTSVPLSTTQKGAIGQFAFLATALSTGKGELEVYSPAADNEGRDAEVRRHLKSTLAIGIQEKVTFETFKSGTGGRARYIGSRFSIVEERIQDDPRLWYFFALSGAVKSCGSTTHAFWSRPTSFT